jgi:hypothetical protein
LDAQGTRIVPSACWLASLLIPTEVPPICLHTL